MNPGAKPTALVTGSSRGIGREIALHLARQGFNLLINGRHESDELQHTQRLVEDTGAAVAACPFDISRIDTFDRVLADLWSRFGGIDCLVNNAGISVKRRGDLLDVAPDSFDEQIAVNLRGTFFLTQQVARRMVAEPGPHFRSIITISSSNAEATATERGEYCIAKAGLSMLTKLFAVRLAGNGINVYEIRPGLIRTSMSLVAEARYDKLLAAGFSPINRWGEPADVAGPVASLASGAMPFATGEVLHLDGGLLIPRY